jgi:hypothetical protein
MGRIIFSKEVSITFIALFFSIAFVEYVSVTSGEVEYVKRFGSLLAAIAALLVIVQELLEYRLLSAEEGDAEAMQHLTPPNREQAEVMRGRRAQQRKEARLKAVMCVAVIAVTGEILHGWGDVLFFPLPASRHEVPWGCSLGRTLHGQPVWRCMERHP